MRSQPPPSYTEIPILTRSPEGGGASLVAQMVKKNLPAMGETQVRSLSQEDPLETGMATLEFHGQRRPVASMGSQRDTTERLTRSLSGGEWSKSPRVHCPLCCGPLPCRVCECRVIVSSIVRNGFPSGSCLRLSRFCSVLCWQAGSLSTTAT